MLRPKCRITFTPKADIIPLGTPIQNVTSTQLFNAVTNPLQETRQTVVFDFCNEIEIQNSFQDLTSTAKITLPRNLTTLDGRPIATTLNSYFRRGDKVKIEASQDGVANLRVIYEGYINRVYFHTPIVIECLDEMFRLMQKKIIYPLFEDTVYIYTDARGRQLKRPKVKVTEIKLKKLLYEVFLNDDKLRDIQSSFECVDTTIYIKDRFDSSVAECLEEIKSQYGLQSYFRDGILHVGFESDALNGNTVEFKFEENIISDEDLNYQLREDVILKVKVESIQTKTNKRDVFEVGDDYGEHRDFKLMNVTREQMKIFAYDKLNNLKFEGYQGTFLTFGEPFAKPGDIAHLTSRLYPEKDGDYQIKSVDRRFGMNGYRQKIQLGARLTFKNNKYERKE